jgi:hypothetical protein
MDDESVNQSAGMEWNGMGWDVPRAFDAGLRIESTMGSYVGRHFVDAYSGCWILVWRQLPVSELIRPAISGRLTQPDQLMVAQQPQIKVAQSIE